MVLTLVRPQPLHIISTMVKTRYARVPKHRCIEQLWLCVGKMMLSFLQEQYILIHEVVLESIRWGNTEIPVVQLPPNCGGEEGGGEAIGMIDKMFKVRQSLLLLHYTVQVDIRQRLQ